MALSRYTKVLLLAPAIGSALIGVFGVLLGVALIAYHGHFANVTHAKANRRATPFASASISTAPPATTGPAASVPNQQPQLLRVSSEPLRRATKPALATAHLRNALFEKAIPSDQLGFLSSYAGRPAGDILREPRLRELVAAVVPYAPFHFGLDMPLPRALESMFQASQVPVAIRDGRYVLMTGIRSQGGRGRGFIWVDTQQGIALGGIFFYPSNGEPTPTLTLFSTQVNRASLGFSQLPPAFVQDLARWATAEGLPPVTTRYFINASSEKTVLAHDEDFCKVNITGAAADPASCSKMNADAAHVDTEASHFLSRVNYASNATMRTANDPDRIGAPLAR